MPRSSRYVTILSGKSILICVIQVMIALIAIPAMAQLTVEDIDALRDKGIVEGWTFSVGETEATAYSLDQLCGLRAPDDWYKTGEFDPCTPQKTLPESYDWRDFAQLPPVRNQGGCGSCWAFATIGPLECNIAITDGVIVDLSEQWLVSCNTDDWGCSGGWWAHAYHQWKKDPCYEYGAVYEYDFPYAASDLPCDCPYPHDLLIERWAYIGSQNSVPPIDAMKQAILDHGPISVSLVANNAMQAYRGGIFNTTSDGAVNHGVVLVGWDDNQGTDGVWFMRNSWGTWWGEDGGYMRIEYGTCRIGYGACYINYPGALQITTESLPSCSLGVSYVQQLEVTGGTGEKTWSDGGSLDGTGLTLDSEGLLSGASTVEGVIEFTASVEDNYNRYAERQYSFNVCKYLGGDANADAEINVGDAVYMINYVFSGGPSPYPVALAGDANCDNGSNVADAVFIINFVFKGGPPPSCP